MTCTKVTALSLVVSCILEDIFSVTGSVINTKAVNGAPENAQIFIFT